MSGQGIGSVFNTNGQQLSFVNGSLFPNGSFPSDTGGTTSLTVDNGSLIGAYNTRNTSEVCTNSPLICTFAFGIMTAGTPGLSSCTVTGAGSGATCLPATGSSISNFGFFITAGSGASSSGTVTANYATSFTGSAPTCLAIYDNTSTAWSTSAIAPQLNATSNSASTFTWNNNGTSLNSGSSYRIGVHCLGK